MFAPGTTLVVSLAVISGWLAVGLLGSLRPQSVNFRQFLFIVGALGGCILSFTAFFALAGPAANLVLPLGLPDLPFHVRLDALSAFFLTLLGAVSAGISLFSAGYFRADEPGRFAFICMNYHFFLASMGLVLLADDAYLFMVAWETMALTSYFLVTLDHKLPHVRHAGFIYLLVAHLGAIAILLSFGVLHGGHGDYTFAALRDAALTPFWGTTAFLLAFFGFGAKAGMLPLHVWLPEAHPAAPSPVSALMSGIMLKTAIYGMIRLIYDLIGDVRWEWGMVVLAIGTLTTLFGVLYALMQHDLKRLLAYHSVENIGIILLGLGMSIVFCGFGHPEAGALGLIAALYHTFNHAVFKSLLFLGAGSILHATGLRNLNDMGGLIHKMPVTAFCFLIGALAISALPPLNGFVSEWLTFQTALQSLVLQNGVVRSLVPLAAAALALAGALTAMCFVKVYGIAFLGQQREPRHAPQGEFHGGDAGIHERAGMIYLAAFCFLLGLFPSTVMLALNRVAAGLIGAGLEPAALKSNWLWLVPTAPAQASYSPVFLFLVIVIAVMLTFMLVRHFYHGRVRISSPWDCGFPERSTRMQDTADAFGQPIRHVFGPIYLMTRHIPTPDDTAPQFSLKIEDRHWYWIYRPVARLASFISEKAGLLQQGQVSVYLLYSFITLVTLLVLVA